MAGDHYFLELEPPEERLRHAPHVVIVGGGFAGIQACRALAQSEVRITLIDKRNFNLFQPLLYQVATGLVASGDIATPLRELVGKQPNVQILLGEVTQLIPNEHKIVFNGKTFSYDHLVLATGSGSSFFGKDNWRTFAPPMKILEHAEEIRRRLLMAMEQAEQTPDPEARQFLQTVVVIGSGPSGCEMAGAASRMLRWSLKDSYQQLDPTQTRILLIDPGDKVLRSMPEELSQEALQALQKTGVEFLQQSRVESMRPGEVVVSTPHGQQCIRAATVIWTAGVRASHLGQALEATTGCSIDRGGRVVVEPDFSIGSHPEIRIAGDLCSYSHTKNGHPLPGMASPAKQAGSFIGKDIAAVVAGRPRPTFHYLDLGSMAIVDGSSAVADLRGLKFSGLIGVLLWAGVHLGLIHDMQQRISLATKWVFALLTRQRASMLLTGMPSQHMDLNAADAHFPMRSGEGPSIASPDAALQAAMEYYSKEISGMSNHQTSNTQELNDTNEDSAADSAAAIK